jgi:hypothetical protein
MWRTRQFWSNWLALAVSIAYVSACGQGAKQTRTHSWKPDASALSHLAPETKFAKYAIRPPANFTFTESAKGDFHRYLWKSGPRVIAPPTALEVVIATPPPKEEALLLEKSLEYSLAGLMKSQQKRFGDWKRSASERGMINGKPFVRATFSATLIGPNEPIKGFMYLTKHGNSLIVLAWQDIGEGIKESEPICEAAVLTFRVLKR